MIAARFKIPYLVVLTIHEFRQSYESMAFDVTKLCAMLSVIQSLEHYIHLPGVIDFFVDFRQASSEQYALLEG